MPLSHGRDAVRDGDNPPPETSPLDLSFLPFVMSHGLAANPVSVSLRRIFPSASFVGCGDVNVTHATDRSGDCEAGSLFAVIRGVHSDGHEFIPAALAAGADALLVDHPLVGVQARQCIVPDVRRSYAELCAAMHGYPSRRLALAGVTGTNGKTTITWMIRSICQAAGKQTGLLGTVEYSDGAYDEPATLTTPGSAALSAWLESMVRRETSHAAIELSSHALEQRRCCGTLLDCAILSNLTQDHFDYHGTFENYRRAKLRILNLLKPAGLAIINMDDAGSRSCLDEAPRRVLTYGLEQPADLTAIVLDESLFGSRFRVSVGAETMIFQISLPGRHNISNALAAIAAGIHFGFDLGTIAKGLGRLQAVPGRVESVDCGQPFHVFVDYAHTDDALARCLGFLRKHCDGRLHCVFGAGGDRDRTKRPLLGKAAGYADLIIVTSDNPRSESPESIIRDIVAGISDPSNVLIEPDRRAAIALALAGARPGDCVLIAGKGHETTQTIGEEKQPFDDREVVRDYFRPQAPIHEPHLWHRSSRFATEAS